MEAWIAQDMMKWRNVNSKIDVIQWRHSFLTKFHGIVAFIIIFSSTCLKVHEYFILQLK